MANNPNAKDNLKPFPKGYDPRRNMRGVPKDAIEARKMIRKIGAELVHIKEKGENGEQIEYDLTRYEAMVRLMYSSRNPAEKIALLKALSPGLLKDEVDLTNSDGSLKPPQIIETIRTYEKPNNEPNKL